MPTSAAAELERAEKLLDRAAASQKFPTEVADVRKRLNRMKIAVANEPSGGQTPPEGIGFLEVAGATFTFAVGEDDPADAGESSSGDGGTDGAKNTTEQILAREAAMIREEALDIVMRIDVV